MKFRFHCFSLPHTVTHIEYNACAYTMKVLKFCKMMKNRGHTIYHYGHSDSHVVCDEHISIMDNETLQKAYGSYDWKKEFFKHDMNDIAHVTFNKRAIPELQKRLQKWDIVLLFWGEGHKPIYDHFRNYRALLCEPGIGYYGSFCDLRIFESWALFNHEYGTCHNEFPSYYHTVIPNYFDIDDFEYSCIKRDYFLCLGRIDKCKGVDIAIRAINSLPPEIPKPLLIIAGQGDITKVWDEGPLPDFVILYGYADARARKELLKYAAGLLLFSLYIEPFGGVVVEAALSGTPVITNNWGAFTETVIHGVTGWRIQNQAEIIWAIRNIHLINPVKCRDHAIARYSLEAVAPLYEKFFTHCDKLTNKKGWYLPTPESMDPNGIRPHEGIWNPGGDPDTRPRIAIFCEGKWAMGRIYTALIKYTRHLYRYTWYNWDNDDDTKAFFKYQDQFELIITPVPCQSAVYERIRSANILLVDHSPRALKDCAFYGTAHQDPEIAKNDNVTIASVEKRGDDVPWFPTGVDIDKFPLLDASRSLNTECKRIGFIGHYPNTPEDIDNCPRIRAQNETKRPQMFLDICDASNAEPVLINGYSITADAKQIYGDIDLLICCSTHESGPLGVFEAAACGIPVLSTRVGLIGMVDGMKFISCANDVKSFLDNTNLTEYRNRVTREIRENWSFEKLIARYWVPAINKKITAYNKTPV